MGLLHYTEICHKFQIQCRSLAWDHFFATLGFNESIEKNHATILENKLLCKLFGHGLFIIRLA